MARTLEEIDADIAKFQARLDKLLDPDRPQSLEHNGRKVSRSGPGDLLDQVKLRLRQLQAERARVAGTASPRAPYTPRGFAR